MRTTALILLLSLPTALLSAADSKKPNLIFVLCDDLGYGDLGVTWQNDRKSEKRHITPHLDRFAAEGLLMTRHYCPAPVCAPSRGSLFTGLHQGHCAVRNNQFDKALPADHTIASTLRTVGYRTALIGKYGLQGNGKDASTWDAYPTKRGFDEFLGLVRHVDGHLHYPAHEWPKGNGKQHQEPKELWHNDQEISAGLSKCFTSDLFTAYAKKWITDGVRASPDQPFFLCLAYDTPHAALQLPTSPYPSGGGLKGGLQWLGEPGKMINTAVGTIDSWVHPDYDQPGWEDEEQRQATTIRRLDDHMGDLVQLLKDLAIDDNTLVVFTSDHGPHAESYLQGGKYNPSMFQAYGPLDGIKRDVLEGGLRPPTIVRWPGTIAGGREDATPSQFHDWMTTFLAVGGAPLPAQGDGVSLLPTLTGKGEQTEPLVYVEYAVGGSTPRYQDFAPEHRGQKRGEQQVIYLDGYKGMRRNIKGHQDNFQIYDLAKDPQEAHDLATSSATFRALEARMKDRVLRVRRPNASAKRPYDQEAIPAHKPPLTLQSGVHTLFLAGDFPWAPRLTGNPAAKTARSPDLAITLPAPGAMAISAYLEVPATGEYTFSLTTTAPAVFRLHQALIIDADNPNEPGGSFRETVKLEKGFHPLHLHCLAESTVPILKWSGPDIEEQVIPAEALHSSAKQ